MDLTIVGSEFLLGTEAKNPDLPYNTFQLKLPHFCYLGDASLGKILVFLRVAGSNTSFLLLIFALSVSFGLTPTKR